MRRSSNVRLIGTIADVVKCFALRELESATWLANVLGIWGGEIVSLGCISAKSLSSVSLTDAEVLLAQERQHSERRVILVRQLKLLSL